MAGCRKRILLVGAGAEQLLAIQQAKDLGMYVVACDGNPSAPGLQLADEGLVVDIRSQDELCRVATTFNVNGIFCHAVEIPQVIARVAEKLNLPGLSPAVAERATNKYQRIRRLTECGIPCARFEVAGSAAELPAKAEKIGFPLVLKPVDNAGSRGVRIVGHADDLIQAYETALTFSNSTEVLLEEVLCGPEISTESVVYNGVIHTFALADRNYAKSSFFYPFFIEDGINFPSVLPAHLQSAIYSLVEKTIHCLGIDFGAAKGDIIIDKGEPKIIEMAARTSGGWFGAGSIPIATGSNMLKPLLQMAVGEKPDLDALRPSRNLGCAQRYIIPGEEGIVTKITGVEEAVRMPGVAMFSMFLPQIGSEISKAQNHAERFGHIICTAPSRELAVAECEAAIAKIKIHLGN